MKKIIMSALVLAVTMGAAQAQTATPDKTHRKEHKMHRLDALNLTEDQKAKLKTLHEQQKKEMEALKKDKEANKEQRKEIHKKYRDQMESILTPEQKQQFEKMKADKKEGRKNGEFKKGEGFGRKGGFDRDGLAKELNLTQDQQDRVAKIRSDFRSQFAALRNDQSLSDDQRKTKFKELMKAQQAQMKTVLTPEQVEKMKSLRKEHSSRNTR